MKTKKKMKRAHLRAKVVVRNLPDVVIGGKRIPMRDPMVHRVCESLEAAREAAKKLRDHYHRVAKYNPDYRGTGAPKVLVEPVEPEEPRKTSPKVDWSYPD